MDGNLDDSAYFLEKVCRLGAPRQLLISAARESCVAILVARQPLVRKYFFVPPHGGRAREHFRQCGRGVALSGLGNLAAAR